MGSIDKILDYIINDVDSNTGTCDGKTATSSEEGWWGTEESDTEYNKNKKEGGEKETDRYREH